MSDIELRVSESWANFYEKSIEGTKPDFICLTAKDHYSLSKALDSNELIKKWNDIRVLVNLEENAEIFFFRK